MCCCAMSDVVGPLGPPYFLTTTEFVDAPNCLPQSILNRARERHRSRSGRFDGLLKKRLHLVPHVTAVAHAIGNPGPVDVTQKIQVGTPSGRGFFDPRWAAAEIVTAIDDRAEEIGVLNQQARLRAEGATARSRRSSR